MREEIDENRDRQQEKRERIRDERELRRRGRINVNLRGFLLVVIA